MTALTVFGTKPQDSIFLPATPYAVRLNCQAGQIAVSDDEFLGSAVEISIIKVCRYFGDLGKTKNAEWLQIFFIPAPSCKVLPSNTVCVTYIKTRSLTAFSQKVTQLMEHGEPAEGVFGLSFVKHTSADRTYYSIKFDWRERKTAAEKKQLDLIAAFMQSAPNLLDTNGTREMVNIEGLSALEVQNLLLEAAKS